MNVEDNKEEVMIKFFFFFIIMMMMMMMIKFDLNQNGSRNTAGVEKYISVLYERKIIIVECGMIIHQVRFYIPKTRLRSGLWMECNNDITGT